MACIDVDKFAEKICDFQAIDEDAANKMIWLLRTFPTADVVEKSECDKWYHEYHSIKDELEREREYLRNANKLSDKYFRELMFSKEALGGLENTLMGLSEIVNEVRKIAADADTSGAVAGVILSEIREAYEKYGGAYGMLQKINELEVRFGVRERDCRDCRCFVGCEAARGGSVCDEFEKIQN